MDKGKEVNGRMKKSTTAKFVASAAALVAAGGVALGTAYALFTSERGVSTHLVISGNLKAELYLKELKQDVLDGDGLIRGQTVDLSTLRDREGESLVPVAGKGVSLTNYGGKIFDGVKLVPTMEGSATFLLENTGDVAFDFTIDTTKTAYDPEGKADGKAAILSQIDWAVQGPESKQVTKGSSKEIKVSYRFKDLESNNDAQEQTMDLDVVFKLKSVTKDAI